MEKTAAGRARSSIREACQTLNGSSASVASVCRKPTRFKPPISIHSIGKSVGRHQLRFHAAPRSDEAHRVTPRAQFARHGQSRHHVAARASARHHEGRGLKRRHPSCSLTLNSIPRHVSVLSSELPPKLIIGSGKPLVGPMSSTTLILINA